MFAESLLETSSAQRTRRSWTTATSFGLQAVVMAVLITIPLLRTVGLPPGRLLPTPISWGAPPPAQPPQREHLPTPNQSNMSGLILVAPNSIPPKVATIDETALPPQVNYTGQGGVEGGTGPASPDGIWKSLGSEAVRPAVAPAEPPRTVRQFKPSTLLQGSLIRRVDPVYPQLARTAHVQGAVVLEAVIGKDGAMQNLQLISGHPLLVQAAIAAVGQWRYRPYILNGEAIEVETRITVNFVLGN